MDIKNQINWRQGKYILPAILYFPLLGLGYLFIDLFQVELSEEKPTDMQTTEYLNSDLPSANVRADIGGKRENVEKAFGDIRDFSGVDNIDDDRDSLMKKEGFDSRYTEKDLALLDSLSQLKADSVRSAKLRERIDQQARASRDRRDQSRDEFLSDGGTPSSVSMMDQMTRDLGILQQRAGNTRSFGDSILAAEQAHRDSVARVAAGMDAAAPVSIVDPRAVKALDGDSDAKIVVKKGSVTSSSFNTLSVNERDSRLIKAIIDENIKAVDGSRVRLRLLDDIEIEGVSLPKGTYIYCTMSGFSSQRVKGKIESVMAGDDIVKVSLTLYDTDGLEGLYVPQSNFRSLAKDVGSQALQGNMNFNSSSTRDNMMMWANNALQNAYSQVSNAVSKHIRQNKAKLKYGTQVYLVNSNEQNRSRNRRRTTSDSEATPSAESSRRTSAVMGNNVRRMVDAYRREAQSTSNSLK